MDDEARVWVLVVTAADDWRPQPPARVVGGMTYTSDLQRNQLHASVIEVLAADGPRVRVLVSAKFRGRFRGFVRPGVVWMYDEDEDGNPRYLVLRLRVTR